MSISDETIILTFGALVIVLRGPEWFGAKEGGGGGRQGGSLIRIAWVQIISSNPLFIEKKTFELNVCIQRVLIKDPKGGFGPFP